MAIKKDLTNNELAAVHSQFKTFRKNNADEDEAYKQGNKTDKGNAAVNWYLSKITNNRFSASSASIGTNLAASKTERWISQKQAMDVFGQEDLEAHVQSGRLAWRESPLSKGVWEYFDHHDIQTQKILTKTKLKTQEEHTDQTSLEDADAFDTLFDDFLGGSANAGTFLDLTDLGLWTAKSKVDSKGAGKGPAVGLWKGFGKGQGKGGKDPLPLPAPPKKLAIEDATEDQKMIMLRDKAKKGVSVLDSCIMDLTCMDQDYKKIPFYGQSKVLKDKVVEINNALNKHKTTLKRLIDGKAGSKGSQYWMDLLVDAAQYVKISHEFMKDVKRGCDRFETSSVAASKKNKK